jgi:hypothetical protein
MGGLLFLCMAKEKIGKKKRHPASPPMAKNAIHSIPASRVTARKVLAALKQFCA